MPQTASSKNTELIHLQLQEHAWRTSSWNRQVGHGLRSWALGNSRQRVTYQFFQKLRAYCGSWRIWSWSDSLPKGGQPCHAGQDRLASIHQAVTASRATNPFADVTLSDVEEAAPEIHLWFTYKIRCLIFVFINRIKFSWLTISVA